MKFHSDNISINHFFQCLDVCHSLPHIQVSFGLQLAPRPFFLWPTLVCAAVPAILLCGSLHATFCRSLRTILVAIGACMLEFALPLPHCWRAWRTCLPLALRTATVRRLGTPSARTPFRENAPFWRCIACCCLARRDMIITTVNNIVIAYAVEIRC